MEHFDWKKAVALGESRGVQLSSDEKFKLHERMFGKHKNKKNTYQKSYYLYDGTTKTATKQMINEFCKAYKIRPDELTEFDNVCPECDGEGHFNDSECCNAEISHGICLDCKEHAEASECYNCNGTGII